METVTVSSLSGNDAPSRPSYPIAGFWRRVCGSNEIWGGRRSNLLVSGVNQISSVANRRHLDGAAHNLRQDTTTHLPRLEGMEESGIFADAGSSLTTGGHAREASTLIARVVG